MLKGNEYNLVAIYRFLKEKKLNYVKKFNNLIQNLRI